MTDTFDDLNARLDKLEKHYMNEIIRELEQKIDAFIDDYCDIRYRYAVLPQKPQEILSVREHINYNKMERRRRTIDNYYKRLVDEHPNKQFNDNHDWYRQMMVIMEFQRPY